MSVGTRPSHPANGETRFARTRGRAVSEKWEETSHRNDGFFRSFIAKAVAITAIGRWRIKGECGVTEEDGEWKIEDGEPGGTNLLVGARPRIERGVRGWQYRVRSSEYGGMSTDEQGSEGGKVGWRPPAPVLRRGKSRSPRILWNLWNLWRNPKNLCKSDEAYWLIFKEVPKGELDPD